MCKYSCGKCIACLTGQLAEVDSEKFELLHQMQAVQDKDDQIRSILIQLAKLTGEEIRIPKPGLVISYARDARCKDVMSVTRKTYWYTNEYIEV